MDLFGAALLLFSMMIGLALLGRAAWLALIRRQARAVGKSLLFGLLYLTLYLVVLGATGLMTPRRSLNPGQAECFDDWCAAGISARLGEAGALTDCRPPADQVTWLVTLELSSRARGIQQRARDAAAVLEDFSGQQAQPCSGPLGEHGLQDFLAPGESFQVQMAFNLPAGSSPAGVVIHHGTFPGVLIIGDDQVFLHRPTLLKLDR